MILTRVADIPKKGDWSLAGSMAYFPLMSNAQQLRETEEFFHQQIPITRAMGVRVAAYDGQQFTLVAPIALNFNHLGTAFGGSLSAVATLAGYGLLWLELRDRTCHLVIRQSSLSFRRPVRKESLQSAVGRTKRHCERSRKRLCSVARHELAWTSRSKRMGSWLSSSRECSLR